MVKTWRFRVFSGHRHLMANPLEALRTTSYLVIKKDIFSLLEPALLHLIQTMGVVLSPIIFLCLMEHQK